MSFLKAYIFQGLYIYICTSKQLLEYVIDINIICETTV
jgi:hypothetical protein